MATLKEQREKLIKARQERLARDAKKQGITPEQLLKKRRDTYLGVVGGAATLALPFGAILRGAKSLFTAAKAVKKGKDASKALKTSKTKKTPSTTTTKTTKTTTTKKVDTKKTPTKTTKKVDTKKTPTKQTKKVDKKKTTKKTDTKKKISGSTIPKVIGAGGTAALLTTIIAKKKDGSAKAGAMPKSRPKSIKPTDFGMGMVDDFSKSKVRRTDNMEGGTAPIKPKKKKSDISQGSTMAKTPKKAKPITAGGNVGFGPKGNIFPKNAADRKRLMDKFGGTGSAAAKAAAQGKQGNLKKVGRT
jgi:hypothetical protein